MIPLFQRLTGKNPTEVESDFPSVNTIPIKVSQISSVLPVATEAGAKLLCRLVHNYPMPRQAVTRAGYPVFENTDPLPPELSYTGARMSDLHIQASALPGALWGRGAYQLFSDWTLILEGDKASWTIGGTDYHVSSKWSDPRRIVSLPSGVPFRILLEGPAAESPSFALPFSAHNPRKDYSAILQQILNYQGFWSLPIPDPVKQAAAMHASNQLATPAILAEITAALVVSEF